MNLLNKSTGPRGPSRAVLACFMALGMATAVQAQSPPASAASAAPATPPASAAKRDLAQRFIVLQQGSIDNLVRNLVEAPARQMMAAGDPVLQTRVAADKREAAVKQVQEDVRKYVESALPIVRDRAAKLSQSVLLPAVEEQFTEDELRQIVTFLESPVQRKLQQTLPELSQTLAGKLVAETRPQIDPKLKALEAAMAKTLGVPPAKPSAATPSGSPGLAGSGLTPSGTRSTPLVVPSKPDKAASKP
jgi:hypothetical protein